MTTPTTHTNSSPFFVTFVKKHSARTGNILFQYLFAKTVEYYYSDCKYIPLEECILSNEPFHHNTITINDENSKEYISLLKSC
jgi:hypothetical protein